MGVKVHRLKLPYAQSMGYRQRSLGFSLRALGDSAPFRCQARCHLRFELPLTIAIPAVLYRVVNPVPMVFEVRDAWPELPIALGVLKNRVYKWWPCNSKGSLTSVPVSVVALSPGMKDSVARTGTRESNRRYPERL